MIPTRTAGRLAPPLALLIGFAVAPVRGQGPASDPGAAPLAPSWTQSRGAAPATPGPPATPAVSPPPPYPIGDPPTTGPSSTEGFPSPTNGADATPPAGGLGQPPPPAADSSAIGGGFGGPGGGKGEPGYGVAWYPSRPVSGQGTDLGLVRQNLSVPLPVWRDGGDAVMMNLGVSDSHFTTDAILPDTRQPFPTDLWNVNLGLNYTHRFENGWTGGLMTSFGSASDQPFHSLRDMTYGLGATLRIPVQNDRDSWMFGLMYSPSGTLNFPIPMASYNWNPSDRFHMSIGLPLAVMWRPTDDLAVNLSYAPLTNVNALATYKLGDPLRIYGGYQFLTESYFLTDRPDAQDRFFAYEQRLVVGAKWNVWKQLTLDLNGGYAFDCHYGEGKNETSSLIDQVDVAPGAFLGMKLNWKF